MSENKQSLFSQCLGCSSAILMAIILLVTTIPVYFWEKIFPDKAVDKFSEKPVLNLVQLGEWGQSYSEVFNAFCFQADFSTLEILENETIKDYFVYISVRGEDENELDFELDNVLKEQINTLFINWAETKEVITKKTYEFYQKKYDGEKFPQELRDFIASNYFKINQLIVMPKAFILDCDNAFDEEHGLAIYVSDSEIKVNTQI